MGSEFANWFLNLWAHQTLLDGCDCLFAMEMLKANEAEGEGRISWGQYHGDNGRTRSFENLTDAQITCGEQGG